MLASHRAMDTLKGIGLNLYERKLWVALLARGASTAGELSEIAGVPRSRSYDILQSLAEKGFVVVQTARPIRYVAIHPQEALERAKNKIMEATRITLQRIDEMKVSPVMKELNEIHGQGLKLISPEELTGSLKGKSLITQQLASMFKDANKKISIVTTPEGLNELFSFHFEDLRRAKERGVQIRIAAGGIEKSAEAVKSLNEIAEIRHLDQKEVPITGRFAVVDSKELVFSLTDTNIHSSQDLAFWSKSEHAAQHVLEPFFNLLWDSSKPIS